MWEILPDKSRMVAKPFRGGNSGYFVSIKCLQKSIFCCVLLHKDYWFIFIFSQKWVLRVSQGGSILKKVDFLWCSKLPLRTGCSDWTESFCTVSGFLRHKFRVHTWGSLEHLENQLFLKIDPPWETLRTHFWEKMKMFQ